MSDKQDPAEQPSTSSALSTQVQQQNQQPKSIAQLMDMLQMVQPQEKKGAKKTYAFWETQPVMQFTEKGATVSYPKYHCKHTGCCAKMTFVCMASCDRCQVFSTSQRYPAAAAPALLG